MNNQAKINRAKGHLGRALQRIIDQKGNASRFESPEFRRQVKTFLRSCRVLAEYPGIYGRSGNVLRQVFLAGVLVSPEGFFPWEVTLFLTAQCRIDVSDPDTMDLSRLRDLTSKTQDWTAFPCPLCGCHPTICTRRYYRDVRNQWREASFAYLASATGRILQNLDLALAK